MYFTHDFTLFDVSLFNFSNTLSTHQIFFFTSPPLNSSILTVYLLIIQFFVSLFFSFIMLTLISYFIFFFVYFSSMNDLLVHVTNFVVLWFSSHSLSQNSWERGKSTRYSAMSNSSLQYYFWPEWQNFTQNRPEFGMTQNMGVTCTSLSTRTKNSSHSSKNKMEFKTLPQPPSSSLFLFLFFHYFFSLN